MNPVPKRRKRMYYSASLISLLLFPLLCLYFMGRNGLYTDLRVMEINWLGPKIHQQFFPQGIQFYRQYTNFDLTDDKLTGLPKTALLKRHIKSLAMAQDTTHGIHVKFGDKTRYETFMQVLDACHASKANFAPDGYDLWIFFQPRPKYRPSHDNNVMICDNSFMTSSIENNRVKQERFEETYYEALEKAPRNYSLPAVLFLLMFGITIWYQHQKSIYNFQIKK